MPKIAPELIDAQIRHIRKPGYHAVGGVAGLHLQVTDTGARSWVLRKSVAGKRRDMGLGSYPEVTPAMAREKAREARELIDRGIDPILQRKQAKSALMAAQAAAKTFSECALAYIDAKSPEWSNLKHVQQWQNTLATYAYPKLGKLLVADVSTAHVLEVLKPIWTDKTETATRVRARIEAVLDWATVQHYRFGPNPARWKGHLDALLPKPWKVRKVEHHPALKPADVPAFMERLRAADGMGAQALDFTILTAARSGESRLATWKEFDLAGAVWTVPADRMKAGKEHRVPLSKRALQLLKALPRGGPDDLVFPGDKPGRPLSDMTLSAVLRRMGVDAVPHGFRSSFKDWAADFTHYPNEMSEVALAHTVDDKTEAAYRRGDMFEKRRHMMDDWAKFCARPLTGGTVVVPLKKRA